MFWPKTLVVIGIDEYLYLVMSELEIALSKQVEEQQKQIIALQNQLDAVVKLISGKKSEKRSFVGIDQIGMFTSPESKKPTGVDKKPVATKSSKRKEKPVRKALPENLRREIIEIEPDQVPEGSVRIGQEITEVLEIRVAEVYVKRYVRNKYALPNEQGVIIGALPKLPIHKSNAGASILAYLMVSKYIDHMPWYRIINKFRRSGFELSDSTVNNWFKGVSQLLLPLYNIMVNQVKRSDYLQVDESTIPVLDSHKKGSTHTGYFWVYHSPPDKVVIFDYQKGRGAKFPEAFLEDFTGYIQTDAYAGYNFIGRREDIAHIGCMAHARREFIEAEKNDRERSETVIKMVAELYNIETQARESNMDNHARQVLRQQIAVPVLERIKLWLDENIYQTTPDSKIGKAIGYMLGHWDKLSGYVKDGQLEIDNNLAENKIRLLALGRKNFLFAGNHDAAQNAAMIYSCFGTCKANDINPNHLLEFAIQQLPYCKTSEDYSKLLPQNFEGV